MSSLPSPLGVKAVGAQKLFDITVTLMLSMLIQPNRSVMVTTYVVLESGPARGSNMLGLLRPAAGDHEYSTPPLTLSCTAVPIPTVSNCIGTQAGPVCTVT